ncbi:MAG: FtsX-like permease family protein, partial [Verrucomicrobiota bacterium]|nr:FtsX-like permease family protein [Verrucomicrobiota bacterium]
VIWIPIKGIQQMEGHDPAAAQSVSAVLLSLRGAAGFQLDMRYNKRGNQATLAWPVAATLASFFERLSWFEEILSLVAFLVAFIGALIIFATLRTVMNEKKREFAILRCLGASRMVVTCVVLSQSLLLAVFGALGSLLAYGCIGFLAARLIREQTGVVMESMSIDLAYHYFLPVVLAIGLMSGLAPALQAYRSSLSDNLSPRS